LCSPSRRQYRKQRESFLARLQQEQQIPRRRAYNYWIKKCLRKWRLLND
jgi:hypothetical protein